MSMHHRVKQSSKSTAIGMSSIAYVMLCSARDQSCGQQAFGTSIMTMLQHIPLTWFRLFWQKTRLMWFTRLHTLLIPWFLGVPARKANNFLTDLTQWKSNESTKRYLTQMLLSINWHYWQMGKNSRICMKVQGCLMQRASLKSTRFLQKKNCWILF
jgi:hypothetical protein